MYPIEYLLLGPQAHSTHVQVTIHEKLNTVLDGNSLRMFLWKLHNTVSSSIARSEAWYHRDEQAHLGIVRDEFQLALSGDLTGHVEQVVERAERIIPLAENAILTSRFLQEAYHYNPNIDMSAPHFSAEEEALARSGYFVEA